MAPNRRELLRNSSVLRKGTPSLADLTNSLIDDEPQVVEVVPDNALVQLEDGSLGYKRFVLTGTGLVFPVDMTEAEWEDVGRYILRLRGALNWWIGDWLAEGDNRKWGETYQKLATEFGYEIETLWSYTSVCRSVNSLIRNQGLYFGHHRAVMSKSQDEQVYWLDQAAANRWTVEQLKIAIKGGDPNAPTLPGDDGPMERFERRAIRFQKAITTLLKKAGQGDRRQMADWLRQIADKIESGQ